MDKIKDNTIENIVESKQIKKLAPPELRKVPDFFAKELGKETTERLVRDDFGDKCFENIMSDLISTFPDGTRVGIRAGLCAVEPGVVADISSVGQNIRIVTIDELISRGGESTNTNLKLTRPGVVDDLGNDETDMSKTYLKFAIDEALKSKDQRVIPIVMVYDLEKSEKGESSYEFSYPDENTKKNALIRVYPIDITNLRDNHSK